MGANQSHAEDDNHSRRRKLVKKGAECRQGSEPDARKGSTFDTNTSHTSNELSRILTGYESIPQGGSNYISESSEYTQQVQSPQTSRAKVVIPHRSSVASSSSAKPASQIQRPDPDVREAEALEKTGNQGASALELHNARVREQQKKVDKQTGERTDFTAVWHSLAHKASETSLWSTGRQEGPQTDERPPGEPLVASLSAELWQHIASFLSPCDAASLTIASRTLLHRIGYATWLALWRPGNLVERVGFLLNMEQALPNQLICFNCGAYHRRTHPGSEKLQEAMVVNPLVACPQASNPTIFVPRLRLAPGWNLPFAFAQLAVRYQRLGAAYGMPASSLDRRWRDPTDSRWIHRTAFFVDSKSGHLLMRVSSWVPAEADLPPAGMRNLLFDKADYTPHFSVCAHWRDGELTPIAKCALRHIPPEAGPGVTARMTAGVSGGVERGVMGNLKSTNNNKAVAVGGGTGPAGQCGICRPMRRCPECPTEYLVELRLLPRSGAGRRRPIAHGLSVTRWSDLGDGRVPFCDEWAACVGFGVDTSTHDGAPRPPPYDSLARVGARTVAATFEARFGDSVPSQRVLSLNPRREKKGIDGHRWW